MLELALLSGIFVLMLKISIDMARIYKFFTGAILIVEDQQENGKPTFYKQ